MSDWNGYDSNWESSWQDSNSPSGGSSVFRGLMPLLGGIFIGFLLTWGLLRWPVSQPYLIGFFTGNNNLVDEQAPISTQGRSADFGSANLDGPDAASQESVEALPPQAATESESPTIPIAPQIPAATPIITPINTSTPLRQAVGVPTRSDSPGLSAETSSALGTITGEYLPDILSLQKVMLNAINEDRINVGLAPVVWDATAELAGRLHATDMLESRYFSHWDLMGYGPEHRYALTGGTDAVSENIYTYSYTYSDDTAAPIENWDEIVRQAQQSLMESPGHRRNILDPMHTHVGIGMAYDSDHGVLTLAQEFINRWSTVDRIPAQVSPSDALLLQGVLLDGASNPLINLAYQPLPDPFTSESVPQTSYANHADIVDVVSPTVKGNRFVGQIVLPDDRASGLYLVRLWVEIGGENVLVSEQVAWLDQDHVP